MPLAAAALAAVALLPFARATQETEAPPAPFASFAVDALVAAAEEEGRAWTSFLDRATLEVGLYRLAAGAQDHQEPHARDEVYLVHSGKARFRAGEQEVDVAAGSILFVAAGLEHRFFDVREDLELVVLFSKAPVGKAGK